MNSLLIRKVEFHGDDPRRPVKLRLESNQNPISMFRRFREILLGESGGVVAGFEASGPALQLRFLAAFPGAILTSSSFPCIRIGKAFAPPSFFRPAPTVPP